MTTLRYTQAAEAMATETLATDEDEKRFVFIHNDPLDDEKFKAAFDCKPEAEQEYPPGTTKADFKDKFRAGGGSKGKTGSSDFTKGKSAFVRPCTVGWKSQNQPPRRGGGKRTPRQKG
jgi:hypothetical protein